MRAYLRSNAIALLALFVALGGSSYAALKLPANSVGTKQLRNGAVTAKKVRAGSLLAKDFKAGQLPRGADGIPGPKGDTGLQGPPGQTGPQGSARAYALVYGNATFTSFPHPGFLAVARVPATSGAYCLQPAQGVDSTQEPAIVSGDRSISQNNFVVAIADNIQAECPSGWYQVRTYTLNAGSPTQTDEGFSIIVP